MSTLPFVQIPPYPSTYTAGTVLGRIVDSLGFRYHWATSDLSVGDLSFSLSESSRSVEETLVHIYHLVMMVQTACAGGRMDMPATDPGYSFADLRLHTLNKIQEVSTYLKEESDKAIEGQSIRFNVRGKEYDYPFWNAINGPISDSLYHVGQIVALRRANGNPMDPNVRVFLGKKVDNR